MFSRFPYLTLLATAVIGSAVVAEGAQAADLPFIRPLIESPRAQIFNWTGGYVGIHAGYASGSSNATEFNAIKDATNPNYCQNNGDGTYFCNVNGALHPINAPMSSFNAIGDSWGMKTRGYAAGVTLGYNWQAGGFVYGVEADYGKLTSKGDSRPSPVSQDDTFLHTSATNYMTARLRVGYAFDRLLVFATGGAASANFESYVDDPDIPIGIRSAKTGLQWGYAVGVGGEYAVTDRLSLKVDWLHMAFAPAESTGYVNVTCTDSCPPDWKLNRAGTAGEGTFGWRIKHNLDLIRAGVNYRF